MTILMRYMKKNLTDSKMKWPESRVAWTGPKIPSPSSRKGNGNSKTGLSSSLLPLQLTFLTSFRWHAHPFCISLSTRFTGFLDLLPESAFILHSRQILKVFCFRLQEAVERNAELVSAPSNPTTSTPIYYDVQNGDKRPANLVRKFGELYSLARLETLDALDTLDELLEADELKNKLLFSVVVVS